MERRKGIVMAILLCEDAFGNSDFKKFMALPSILVGKASCLYILVRELHDDLERYIRTGRAETAEFRVFSEVREAALVGEWTRRGCEVTYGSQKVDYMEKTAKITYLIIKDASSGMKISLIPWFMAPGRPYPVFVYLYAIWHYHKTGKKSLKQSAAAAGKLFKIKSFDKSTVCRAIKAMKDIADAARITAPLSVEEPEMPADDEVLRQIPELIGGGLSADALKGKYGGMIGSLPGPVRQAVALDAMLNEIPGELADVFKTKAAGRVNARDARARPARERKKAPHRVQQRYDFADHPKLEGIRAAFIEVCRRLVMGAAAKYHCFLA